MRLLKPIQITMSSSEDNEIIAPESIVVCIREFVASIRNDWDTLSEPLAKALDQNS